MNLPSQRRAIIAELVDHLASDLPGVTVTGWFPANQLADHAVWFGVPTGDVEIPVFAGGQLMYRDDVFRSTITTHWFTPGAHPDQALAGVEERLNTVEQLLVAGKAAGWANESVISIVPVSIDGPGTEPHPNNEGWFGYGALTIEVHARLS